MKYSNLGHLITAGSLATLMIGCGGSERNVGAERTGVVESASPASPPDAHAPDASPDRRPVILFMGTSLTAGLGLPVEQSYPSVVDAFAEAAGLPVRVINGGVSGETSAGALRRVDWLLQQPFDILVVETGANDMLRGTSVDELERNIQSIIDRVREERPEARIVLAGMRAAPNLGRTYVDRFEAVYPRLAARNDIELIPFILEGVAAEPDLNLGDGMHPNAAGQQRIAENVWAVLAPIAGEVAASRGG